MKLDVLAKRILDFFCVDAADWPLHNRGAEPTVWFQFPVKPYISELAGYLDSYLRTWDNPKRRGRSLRQAENQTTADVVIVLEEQVQDGDLGLGYEIHFKDSEDVFPGWFSLVADD